LIVGLYEDDVSAESIETLLLCIQQITNSSPRVLGPAPLRARVYTHGSCSQFSPSRLPITLPHLRGWRTTGFYWLRAAKPHPILTCTTPVLPEPEPALETRQTVGQMADFAGH
jgi:hypothetical protein